MWHGAVLSLCRGDDVTCDRRHHILYIQDQATFSELGPDETFRSSSGAGVTNENPNMRMYILQYFYCKAGKSVRRLVLLAMKKYFSNHAGLKARCSMSTFIFLKGHCIEFGVV